LTFGRIVEARVEHPEAGRSAPSVSFYVAIFRRAGRGERLYSYPSLAEFRQRLGLIPLRHDESVTVYRFDSPDCAGEHVDPLEWRSL
jgi:hypothetical protein